MEISARVVAAMAPILVLCSTIAGSAEQSRDVPIPAESIKLAPAAGPGLPPGVQSAVVFGNVSQPGVYVLRNRFPPNATLNPTPTGRSGAFTPSWSARFGLPLALRWTKRTLF